MFNGTWSTGTVSGGTSGSGGSGGTWSTAPAGSTTDSSGSSGTWSTGSTAPVSSPAYSSFMFSGNESGYYVGPGAGLRVGPYGENGSYTPLDYPLVHELRQGQRLEGVNGSSDPDRSTVKYLVLGVILVLLLKKGKT